MICFPPNGTPGKYPIETLPSGWKTAIVKIRDTERYQIINQKDLLCYKQEPMGVIAYKCMGLFFLVLPLYMTLYTIAHLIRLPVVTYTHRSLKVFGDQIVTLVRIPFFWIALQSAALYGMIRPLEGRAWFAHLELAFHGGKKRSDAFDLTDCDLIGTCKEFLTLKQNQSAVYAALCFLSYGRADNPKITVTYPSQNYLIV